MAPCSSEGSLVRLRRGAMMFFATALLYPCVLAALSLGTGLLVDRFGGGRLAAPLLLPVGAAGLIALSQLCTYLYFLAPATPYAMALLALAGFALARARATRLLHALLRLAWPVGVSVLAYLLALAPVLIAGRSTFSSFMALSDSAVHLIGADYLLSHGQHFAHLDLANSYGRFISGYYHQSNYPSGADTMFGGSAFLLGLPLIWAFQPFNAFMLALAVGPAWMLARRMGLRGAWAALAALSAVLGALVYAYELFGSIKEITALPLILALGALVSTHRSWLDLKRPRPASALAFALLLAGGVSALGVAFGTWVLVSVAMLALIVARELLDGGKSGMRSVLTAVAGGAAILLVAAWPTWIHIAGSVEVAQGIASTSNPGNLHSPLRAIQVFGVWLGGSYKLAPRGGALDATHVLIAVSALAALLGAVQLLRRRELALGGWMALMLLSWLLVSVSVSTWAAAKVLMLTSPVVVLLAWGGVGALRNVASRALATLAASLLALALVGGVLVSDALQYHVTNLAPTARYRELASLDSRFAGNGPTLFTDFDEYSMYELRRLDVGGPNFVYPPPALADLASGYGEPVRLDRASPQALAAYPLIVTRREPGEIRPPAVYSLVWQGSYYQVWRRQSGGSPAIRHLALTGSTAGQCRRIGDLVTAFEQGRHPGALGALPDLVAAVESPIVRVDFARAAHPRRWGHERNGLVMSSPGRLTAIVSLPRGGRWDVWVQGQLMTKVDLSVDGRRLATISGQLSGNSLVAGTVPPVALHLGAGTHRLSISRGGSSLVPGNGGAAVLDSITLTQAEFPADGELQVVPIEGWRRLCGSTHQWVELVGA